MPCFNKILSLSFIEEVPGDGNGSRMVSLNFVNADIKSAIVPCLYVSSGVQSLNPIATCPKVCWM